jgi:DNA-binding response OmpR family regulator
MPNVLWVDLRTSDSETALDNQQLPGYPLHRHAGRDEISEKIQEVGARVLIFEYDFPDAIGLRALQRTKAAFPFLPLFMVTEEHSEELAIWAFRTGVRDFLIKPIGAGEISSRLTGLLESFLPASRPRSNVLPTQPIPMAARGASYR